MQGLVEDFIEENDVEFKLVVVVNGEEIIKYTSIESFDDVSGYAELADRAFDKYVVANIEDERELEAEAQLEESLDNKRGIR